MFEDSEVAGSIPVAVNIKIISSFKQAFINVPFCGGYNMKIQNSFFFSATVTKNEKKYIFATLHIVYIPWTKFFLSFYWIKTLNK